MFRHYEQLYCGAVSENNPGFGVKMTTFSKWNSDDGCGDIKENPNSSRGDIRDQGLPFSDLAAELFHPGEKYIVGATMILTSLGCIDKDEWI